jgi:acetylornithine deacetylase/succinyl-diaminopimelate desuccinylase-like protein
LIEGLAFDAVCDVTLPDAVVIGEPTGLALAVGQRGRAEIEVEAIGSAGHSAYPETAVNAIDKMMTLLPRLYAAPLPEPHEIVGPALLVATDIVSSPLPANSTIPESCRVTFDRRLLPGETPESVLAPLRAALDAVRHEDPTLKARVELAWGDFVSYSGRRLKGAKFLPGWFTPLESRLVECAAAALRSVKITPRITSYLTCTNGSCSAGMRGVPTIGFGPGDDEQSHRTDEWVRLSALHQAVIGYTALARWLSAMDAVER